MVDHNTRPEGARCSGCYNSFSGPWCDNCDQWPCICSDEEEEMENA